MLCYTQVYNKINQWSIKCIVICKPMCPICNLLSELWLMRVFWWRHGFSLHLLYGFWIRTVEWRIKHTCGSNLCFSSSLILQLQWSSANSHNFYSTFLICNCLYTSFAIRLISFVTKLHEILLGSHFQSFRIVIFQYVQSK